MKQSVLQELFKDSMSQLASGVSIVTSKVDRRPWGLTISACCSISLDPTLLLISLAKNTASTKSIIEQKKFGLSILSNDQIDIAKAGAVAGKPKYFDEFVEKDQVNDIYIVKNAISQISCSVYEKIPAGDHVIFLGKVERVINNEKRNPLLYFSREF